MFYFAHCMNVIFNDLRKHTTRKIKSIHVIFYHILLLSCTLVSLLFVQFTVLSN